MLVTSLLGILCVFLVVLESAGKFKRGLIMAFILLFIFLLLRYDFGNDYLAYYKYFIRIHDVQIKDLSDFSHYEQNHYYEPGYTYLNKIFPSFFLLVGCLALLTSFIYYSDIKWYVTKNMMWFSVFMLIFDPYLMLVQSSAIRQTVAICLFLYSIRYLIERNFWKYALCIVIGYLFHKSAIVLLPIYFIATPSKWSRKVLAASVICFFFITFLGFMLLDSIGNIANTYFPDYQKGYMADISGNQLNTGLGFIFLTLVFFFIIWSHKKGEPHNLVISKLSIIGFVLYPLGMYLNMFTRIFMYFSPVLVLSLPYALSLLASKKIRLPVIILLLVFYLWNYFIFFQNPIWLVKFSTYKTIFSSM